MNNKYRRGLAASFCISIVLIAYLSSSFKADSSALNINSNTNLIRKTLDSLYNAFSFGAGAEPDWYKIRQVAIGGAAFVSAPSDKLKRFAINVEEFIKDYKSNIIKHHLNKTGYSEHIISADIRQTANVATANVIFKAFIKGDNHPRKPGEDNIQLLFDQGTWKIVAFTTQSESTPE